MLLACRLSSDSLNSASSKEAQVCLQIYVLLSCRLFLNNLESVMTKEAQKTAQEQDPAQVTHADKIEKKEGLLKWSRSATELHNQVISNLVTGNLFVLEQQGFFCQVKSSSTVAG